MMVLLLYLKALLIQLILIFDLCTYSGSYDNLSIFFHPLLSSRTLLVFVTKTGFDSVDNKL